MTKDCYPTIRNLSQLNHTWCFIDFYLHQKCSFSRTRFLRQTGIQFQWILEKQYTISRHHFDFHMTQNFSPLTHFIYWMKNCTSFWINCKDIFVEMFKHLWMFSLYYILFHYLHIDIKIAKLLDNSRISIIKHCTISNLKLKDR